MDLFEKYDQVAPRYTSYPPVPFWSGSPCEEKWFEHVNQDLNKGMGADLYIHIPFCEKLCWYCGCHRTISKNKDRGDQYIDSIIQEWAIYQKNLDQDKLMIHSIHFGGGTPTFLKPKTLDYFLKLFDSFRMENFIGAMEIDPRTCLHEHLEVLHAHGFKRISMGIQDFDEKVQKAINRVQPYKMVKDLVDKVRDLNFDSLNFDLIYGLPKQTYKSIKETISLVNQLSPDLIAFYSYAHLPERLSNQKLINEDELPSGKDKRMLYEKGRELLLENGYIEIGLDHFAKKESYLGKAFIKGKLQRSFMGYTDEKTPVMIGLGVSAISSTSESFIQNHKEISSYTAQVDQGYLAIDKGHVLSSNDKYFGDIINQLMCTGKAQLNNIEQVRFYQNIIEELKEMTKDGLIDLKDNKLFLTHQGHPFMRNIAKIFDYHLRERSSNIKFSRTL